MLFDGLEGLSGAELLLVGFEGELGDMGLAPGAGGEELSGEEGEALGLPLGVEEPEEAAPGLDGLEGIVEGPEDEEGGGVLLVLLPVVLDSLLHPASAAAIAAAQQILARLPKVGFMC